MTPGSTCPKKQRQLAAEYLHFNDDGSIREVERTTEGLSARP